MFTGSGAHSGYAGGFANGEQHNRHHTHHVSNFSLFLLGASVGWLCRCRWWREQRRLPDLRAPPAADRIYGTLWTPGDPDERPWEEAHKIWQEYPELHGTDDAPKLGAVATAPTPGGSTTKPKAA